MTSWPLSKLAPSKTSRFYLLSSTKAPIQLFKVMLEDSILKFKCASLIIAKERHRQTDTNCFSKWKRSLL